MMTIASAVKGISSISLFWAAPLLSSTQKCLAFQVNPARIVKRNPFIVRWQSIPTYYQELMPSDMIDRSPLLPSPHAILTARDVATTCMDALLQNDRPRENSGLQVCFDFSSDRCRASLGGSLEEFIAYANNPTFGSMTNAEEYAVLGVGPVIAASMTRGAMQTVLVKVVPAKGKDRTFLWTMQQERRPPRQGLWLVHECICVENAFALTF